MNKSAMMGWWRWIKAFCINGDGIKKYKPKLAKLLYTFSSYIETYLYEINFK